MKNVLSLLLFVAFSMLTNAQQFVYKPINPAFGGETFNYQMLLSSAAAQNPYDNKDYDYSPTSMIESFSDQLNRQILNKISNGLFGGDYGSTTMEPGIYNYGNMNINISEYFGGINIRIIDIINGDQTDIMLPNM